jgi:hypothetical protein
MLPEPVPTRVGQHIIVELKKDRSFSLSRIIPKKEISVDWRDYAITDAILGDGRYVEDHMNFSSLKIEGLDFSVLPEVLGSVFTKIDGIDIRNHLDIRAEVGFFSVNSAEIRSAMVCAVVAEVESLPMECLRLYNRQLALEAIDSMEPLLANNRHIKKLDFSQTKIYGIENIGGLKGRNKDGYDIMMKKIEGNLVEFSARFLEKIAQIAASNDGLEEIDLSSPNASAPYSPDSLEPLQKVVAAKSGLKIRTPDGNILTSTKVSEARASTLETKYLSK